jgi:flagellar L-ring protein precursor FlgH
MNKPVVLVLIPLLLAGCAQHEFTPVMSQVAFKQPSPTRVVTGSIYQDGRDLRLFEDRTARRVGDIVTIRLAERTDASKKASTSMNKNDEFNLANPTLFGLPFSAGANNLEMSGKGDRKFDGSGASDQSNSLKGQITAVVVDVYPNNYLAIKGEKMLTLNQGEELVQIAGVVRPEDIAADNSVLSTQIADAKITYTGQGAIADANTIGWLMRFFISALMPY